MCLTWSCLGSFKIHQCIELCWYMMSFDPCEHLTCSNRWSSQSCFTFLYEIQCMQFTEVHSRYFWSSEVQSTDDTMWFKWYRYRENDTVVLSRYFCVGVEMIHDHLGTLEIAWSPDYFWILDNGVVRFRSWCSLRWGVLVAVVSIDCSCGILKTCHGS